MSSKQVLIMVGPLCVLVMAAAAFMLLRAPAAASEPIQAIPLTPLTAEELGTATEPAWSSVTAIALDSNGDAVITRLL